MQAFRGCGSFALTVSGFAQEGQTFAARRCCNLVAGGGARLGRGTAAPPWLARLGSARRVLVRATPWRDARPARDVCVPPRSAESHSYGRIRSAGGVGASRTSWIASASASRSPRSVYEKGACPARLSLPWRASRARPRGTHLRAVRPGPWGLHGGAGARARGLRASCHLLPQGVTISSSGAHFTCISRNSPVGWGASDFSVATSHSRFLKAMR